MKLSVLILLALGVLTTSSAQRVVVTAPQKSNTKEIKAGSTVEIHLPYSPGTGYDWQVVSAPKGLKVTRGKDIAPKRMMPGAANTAVFVVRFDKVGSSALQFGLFRPWEKGAKPEQPTTFRFKVQQATSP